MKKITSIITTLLVTTILIIGCSEKSKKDISDAKENMKEAKQNIKDAVLEATDKVRLNAILNWKSFKNESDSAVAGLEKNVAILEGKMNRANDAAKTRLKMDLDNSNKKLQKLKEKLKQKNTEFENDTNKFDASVDSRNQSFQREFKHDIEQLGLAVKDIFRNNVK